MKRFSDNTDKNGVKRFISNYGDNMTQQQQSPSTLSKDLLYGVSMPQYYNGAPQQQHQQTLNKDQQQFKYSSLTMYPPPSSIEQGPAYYNSYYNNPNWRYPNSTAGTQIGASTFTYDPSQPPPPLPKLKKSESPAPPPLPPLPPGDPPYHFPSPPLSLKSPLSISSTASLQPTTDQNQQQQQRPPPPFSTIDPAHSVPPPHHHPSNIPNNGPRRPPLLPRGGGVFRGGGAGIGGVGRGERPPPSMKRIAYPFNKKGKTSFNKSPVSNNISGGGGSIGGAMQMMNGQKKLINKLQTNSRNNGNDGEEDGDDNLSHIQVNKKAKRKPMSTRYPRKIEWDRGDALKALALEKEYNKLQRNSMLILKFPDPELNKNIVKEYSPYIESVHFQQPSTPRYCFVQLKDGVDIEKVREELCQIPFGVGKIVAERKRMHTEEDDTVNPEDIDPYTLYIGNLPTTITVKTVKEHFPNSRRIDIGYAQRMRYTRYAFIRYETVDDAMEAYRKTFNLLIESRSLIVRFRRQKGNVGLPGESRPSNPKKEPIAANQNKILKINDDAIQQSAAYNKNDSTTTAVEKILNENQDNDDDVYYIGGEPSKFENIDTKDNVLEQSRELAQQRERNGTNSSGNDIEAHESRAIKQEPVEEYDEDDDDECDEQDDVIDQWVSNHRVKDEPIDDDELLRQADCYEETDYTDDDNETEDVDDDVTGEYSDQQQVSDYIKKEFNDKEEKPDVYALPVPFPIFNDNAQKSIRRISHLMSKAAAAVIDSNIGSGETSTTITAITKDQQNKTLLSPTTSSLSLSNKANQYRDDLDELFERMNSEDDDFTF